MAIGTQGAAAQPSNALSLATEFALTAGQAQLILAQLQEECPNGKAYLTAAV